MRRGDLANALAVARKAEQLEPALAGYHLLSGQIMLRLGRGGEAAALAKYVAERWSGSDRDEALELWNRVPAAQRPAGEQAAETVPEGTQALQGRVRSSNCGDKDQGMTFLIDHDGQGLNFHGKGAWSGGFSDTIWYGEDHFTYCHHIEGLRVVVRYKLASDKTYTGDLVQMYVREDLPEPVPVAKSEETKPQTKP